MVCRGWHKGFKEALTGGEWLGIEKKKCYCLAESIYSTENLQ